MNEMKPDCIALYHKNRGIEPSNILMHGSLGLFLAVLIHTEQIDSLLP